MFWQFVNGQTLASDCILSALLTKNEVTMVRKEIENRPLINRRRGAIDTIETIYQMRLKKLFKPSTYPASVESTPYEITQEYTAAMLELERKRARGQNEYYQSRIL